MVVVQPDARRARAASGKRRRVYDIVDLVAVDVAVRQLRQEDSRLSNRAADIVSINAYPQVPIVHITRIAESCEPDTGGEHSRSARMDTAVLNRDVGLRCIWRDVCY